MFDRRKTGFTQLLFNNDAFIVHYHYTIDSDLMSMYFTNLFNRFNLMCSYTILLNIIIIVLEKRNYFFFFVYSRFMRTYVCWKMFYGNSLDGYQLKTFLKITKLLKWFCESMTICVAYSQNETRNCKRTSSID